MTSLDVVKMGSTAGPASIGSDITTKGSTSFDSIPSGLYMPSSHHIQYTILWALYAIYEAVSKFTEDTLNSTITPGITTPSHALSARSFPLDYGPRFRELTSTLSASGYRTALVHGIFAVIINHLRRFCAPWLGAFLFQHPMKDLRLALSNAPDLFLQQTLSYTWASVGLAFVQRWIFDAAALLVMRFVMVNRGHPHLDVFTRPTVNQEALMHLAKIFCWVYGLTTGEYIFARTINVVSIIISLARLMVRGQRTCLVVLNLVLTHWPKTFVLLLMTWYYIQCAFWPIIRGSIASALRGQPGLLLSLAAMTSGVAATLRLRSKLGFMWLELSNFFLILAWLIAIVVFLGYEFVRDPLGLEGSAGWTRRCMTEVRGTLRYETIDAFREIERLIVRKGDSPMVDGEKGVHAKKTD